MKTEGYGNDKSFVQRIRTSLHEDQMRSSGWARAEWGSSRFAVEALNALGEGDILNSPNSAYIWWWRWHWFFAVIVTALLDPVQLNNVEKFVEPMNDFTSIA